MNPSRGRIIEGYEVIEPLGQGAFGVTWRVRDVKLGLQFALKEYFPAAWAERDGAGHVRPRPGQEAAFARGLERFLEEGRTLAGLAHPNVVRVVRHFESGGTACLLMDYLAGRSLHDLLSRGGVFNPAETQALLTPLLDALAYLGGQGVIHGDIKPSNIMVTRDGAPVLLDFGAARVARGAAGAGPATAGSAGYAALEQVTGKGALGPWTDIHGLAATLYRLVTGEIPASAEVRAAAVQEGEPDPVTPLAERLRSAGREGFSRAFSTAVDQGLALHAQNRPRDARTWAKLFGAAVAEDRRPAAPRRPDDRERVILPQVLAGLAIVALLAAVAWVFLGPDADAPAEATPPSTLPETSLARDEDAWEQAVRTDTAAGFRAYLEAFPRGRHAEGAREQLARFDEERWRAVRDTTDLADLERYLDEFPDGRWVVEARARASVLREAEERAAAERAAAAQADDAAFAQARAAGTRDALDDYLAAFPRGLHVEEALELKAGLERASRDEAAWAAARASGERSAFEAYIRAFPGGLHLAEALAEVDRLTLRPGRVFRDCRECPEMVVVPAGTFTQGASPDDARARSNELPSRTVRIPRPFAIGTHEVSFAEWDACRAAGACRDQAVDNGWGRGRRPVIMVTWADAQAYAAWLSQRTGQTYELPSESQWEYVARAGQEGPWAGGAVQSVCDQGNVAARETGFDWRLDDCADPFSLGTAEVGYFAANAMGVHDMVGNVAEWTRDCMNLSYLDAPSDGSSWERGLCSSRVTRGGSWFSGPAEIRLSARFPLRSGESNDFTGLRVVRAVAP